MRESLWNETVLEAYRECTKDFPKFDNEKFMHYMRTLQGADRQSLKELTFGFRYGRIGKVLQK